jgi:hypothetical protein
MKTGIDAPHSAQLVARRGLVALVCGGAERPTVLSAEDGESRGSFPAPRDAGTAGNVVPLPDGS